MESLAEVILFCLSCRLPKQILLNNFLADVSSMTIATDSVDREQVDRPRGCLRSLTCSIRCQCHPTTHFRENARSDFSEDRGNIPLLSQS